MIVLLGLRRGLDLRPLAGARFPPDFGDDFAGVFRAGLFLAGDFFGEGFFADFLADFAGDGLAGVFFAGDGLAGVLPRQQRRGLLVGLRQARRSHEHGKRVWTTGFPPL